MAERRSWAAFMRRAMPPGPWAEGEKNPWDEADFSRRMLHEHLTQEHGRASRQTARIEAEVRWLHESVLGERAGRVLDLGCEPGLYTSALARLGHGIVGIDFSTASVRHARSTAGKECWIAITSRAICGWSNSRRMGARSIW